MRLYEELAVLSVAIDQANDMGKDEKAEQLWRERHDLLDRFFGVNMHIMYADSGLDRLHLSVFTQTGRMEIVVTDIDRKAQIDIRDNSDKDSDCQDNRAMVVKAMHTVVNGTFEGLN